MLLVVYIIAFQTTQCKYGRSIRAPSHGAMHPAVWAQPAPLVRAATPLGYPATPGWAPLVLAPAPTALARTTSVPVQSAGPPPGDSFFVVGFFFTSLCVGGRWIPAEAADNSGITSM